MDSMLANIDRTLGWVPSWAVGLALIAFAVMVALIVYRVGSLAIRRLVGTGHPVARRLLERTSGPIRLALCLAAVAFVLPFAPLEDPLRGNLSRGFALAVITLVGWTLIRAVDIAAARYLQQFRLDTEDNLLARKHVTQVRVFKRVIDTLVVIVAVSAALMTFESVRQYGVSLFASAGAAGIIVGLAARPLLSNLIAGVQIAITQPIRIEDAVIVENEWGWIEDIASTYVVVRLWDWRRMVVPLSYFIEKPFQNWTREGQSLIGAIAFHLDFGADVARIRRCLEQAVRESRLWDGEVVNLQVVETHPRTMELRALVSARNASQSWDLRCEVREKVLAFIRDQMPEAFPRERTFIAPASADIGELSGPKARFDVATSSAHN